MKKRCDNQKELTGRQHFLIKLNNGRLAIVNSDYIKSFNKLLKGKQRPMDFIDLHNFSIYKTKAWKHPILKII